MNRTSMRELAFKYVYEMEVQKDETEEELEIFLENNEITDEKVIAYLKDIKEGLENNAEEINIVNKFLWGFLKNKLLIAKTTNPLKISSS